MVFGLLRNMESKMMVDEAFVFFSPVTPEIIGGS